jgi:hypothetical protein
MPEPDEPGLGTDPGPLVILIKLMNLVPGLRFVPPQPDQQIILGDK